MSYLACCLREMGKSHVEKSDNGTAFVKFLLKARDSDMFPIGQVGVVGLARFYVFNLEVVLLDRIITL